VGKPLFIKLGMELDIRLSELDQDILQIGELIGPV